MLRVLYQWNIDISIDNGFLQYNNQLNQHYHIL